MAITDLNPLPSQETRPDTFDSDVETFFGKLPQFATDIDTARNQAIAAAESGATGFPYTFDSGTTSADPTSGKLRFNNANLTLATAMHVSATSSANIAIGALLDTFDDSTSPIKGLLRIVNSTDPSKWAQFKLTAISTPAAGWRTFSLTPVSASGSTPFSAGNTLAMQFAQNGDKGDTGPQGVMYPILRAREEYASGTPGVTVAAGAITTITRAFNTVKTNTASGSSLSANRFTIPNGTWEVDASGVGLADNRMTLYCVTDSVSVLQGLNQTTNGGVTTLKGEFTVASGPKVYELRHRLKNYGGTSTTVGDPQSTGEAEVYADISFKKLS